MNKNYIIALCLALFIAGGYFFIAHNNIAQAPILETPSNDQNVQTPPNSDVEEMSTVVLPYGETTLKVGETATFKALAVKVVKITSESRCPSDVTCIQAGTVAIDIEGITPQGAVKSNLEIGEKVNVSDVQIIFTGVEPPLVSGTQIPTGAYEFTFEVTERIKPPVINLPKPVTEVPYDDRCYVGGCSAQYCSENPALVSTCEFKEEYACYQKAECARQQSGECGWTESAELNACLMNAGVSTI